MSEKESRMIESAKNGIVTAIKGTGDVAQAAVDTVTKTLSTTAQDAGKTGASVVDATATVAKGVIHGATGVGAHLGHAAKGTVVGVVRATKHTGAEAIDTIGHTARALIHSTAEVGGELGHTATGVVEGAIAAAKEVGIGAEEAASAAAHGALHAADKVGTTALKTVSNVMKETISGVKVVLKAPFDRDDSK